MRYFFPLAVLAFVFAAFPLSSSAAPRPQIVLGAADEIALDQPRVAIEVFDGSQSLGPDIFNTFLLDTGAQGVLIAGGAQEELLANGYQNDGTYYETGVGGSSAFSVSKPYQLDFGNGQRISISNVRMLSTSDPQSYGGFSGIVGTVAMNSRVTTLDNSALVTNYEIGVNFSSSLPAGNGHRYGVAVTMVDFPPAAQNDPNTPLPTMAPLPFVPVHAAGTTGLDSSFVLDTGAQISMISTAMAFQLGLDANNNGSLDDEAIDFMPVGGVGGEILAPRLNLPTLALITTDGVEITWTDAKVLVADVAPEIPGILGSDLLVSGWLDALFGTGTDGYIEQLHLDLLDAQNAMLYLDLNPELDVVTTVPEPATMALLMLGAGLLARRASYRRRVGR